MQTSSKKKMQRITQGTVEIIRKLRDGTTHLQRECYLNQLHLVGTNFKMCYRICVYDAFFFLFFCTLDDFASLIHLDNFHRQTFLYMCLQHSMIFNSIKGQNSTPPAKPIHGNRKVQCIIVIQFDDHVNFLRSS